ncbi:lysozyme inhibitor LprI family protein [Tahibacter amnicola]|uniref:Lysozyme inhibitor LprI family protein n=1 Tax=Tahibacter amnicola TaxID=2976241 RepID=A0ABY6B908_9GAMM|nr:lysozyme inhibitor LprI family protein [Tahibacter amnicola]UXI66548.1 lysozyme inhibitor LprI family protein [Tahibacter amnicola]
MADAGVPCRSPGCPGICRTPTRADAVLIPSGFDRSSGCKSTGAERPRFFLRVDPARPLSVRASNRYTDAFARSVMMVMRNRRWRDRFVLMVAATAAPAVAQEISADCVMAGGLAAPQTHQPTQARKASLSGCDSQKLYYDDADYERARLCAYIEREEGNQAEFSSVAVLMMVYANGHGVARDVDLAKKFACEIEAAAPAETEGRLRHLESMRGNTDPHEVFDVCDDITSGYMMGECAAREAVKASDKRKQRIDTLIARWTAGHRKAFAALQAASTAFIDAVVENEVDMSGTARAVFAIGARESLEEAFAGNLERFEDGQLPSATPASFKQADADLNAAYARAMKAAKADDGDLGLGSIRPEGIREAERRWIAYRDAWVAFGALKYPGVAADAWRQHFTREREVMLKELAGE